MRFSYLLLTFLIWNCASVSELDIQGHRGARGLLPENTIQGFEEALRLGVRTLELDVVISKDGQVVVSHEPFMNHEIALDADGNPISENAEKSFNLYLMTYDSIQLYDVGSKVHPRFPNQKKMKAVKPLMSEVIKMAEKLSRNTIHYNIEIKSQQDYDGFFTPRVDDYVKIVIETMQAFEISNRVTLQSFDVRALETIHQENPTIETSLLIDEYESIDNKLADLTFRPAIISPYFGLIDEGIVAKYHRLDYRIIPWTVNTEKDIKRMLNYKVDGIISDYPDLVLDTYHSELN